MIARCALFCLISFFLIHSASATVALTNGAVRAATEYSRAFVGRNPDTLVRYAHPLLKIRFGGEEKLRASYAQLWSNLDAQQMTVIGEQFGRPSAAFVDGNTIVIGIPLYRYSANGTRQWMNYILASYDAGATWFIFDLGCTDDQWLAALAPRYRGVPKVVVTGDDDLVQSGLPTGPHWDRTRPPAFTTSVVMERRTRGLLGGERNMTPAP